MPPTKQEFILLRLAVEDTSDPNLFAAKFFPLKNRLGGPVYLHFQTPEDALKEAIRLYPALHKTLAVEPRTSYESTTARLRADFAQHPR